MVNSPEGVPAVEDVVFRRHDNTVRYVIPWIESIRPLKGSQVLDFGCGCGSSSLAFSRYADRVAGFEIDTPSVAAFGERMEVAGCENAHVFEHSPEDILDAALDRLEPGTVVLFLAVVEHHTEHERLEYLTRFWQEMAPGDLLVVAETPNFYAYFDGHTFGVPFAQMVPDAYFERWLEKQDPDLRFRNDLLRVFAEEGESKGLERRRRLGMGISHHVFELAFESDLRDIVVADGFCPDIVNWFPISPDDTSLVSAFDQYEVTIPIGFARSVLSFVFKKPESSSGVKSVRDWNDKQRSRVIQKYGR